MKTPRRIRQFFFFCLLGTTFASQASPATKICASLLRGQPAFDRYRTARAFSGYLPALETLTPQAPHTLRSLDLIVSTQLGKKTRQIIEGSSSPVFVVLGHLRTARSKLARMGWKIQETLSESETWFRVVRLTNTQGETAIGVIRIISWDRVTHVQALLRLAGLEASRLHTVWRYHSWKSEYLKTFARLGPAPDLVVYGFAHTALFGLLNEIPGNQSHLAFAETSHRLKNQYRNRTDLNLPQFVHQITLQSGKRIWLLPNVYGDLVKDLFLAAAEHGARRFLFLGTAGALDRGFTVGDWVTPHSTAPIPPLPGVTLRGNYERIESFLLETETWLNQARQRGVDYVDVEWGYVNDLLLSHPQISLRQAFVISDVLDPRARQNITTWSEGHSKQLEPQIARMLQATLGLNSPHGLKIDAITRALLSQN